MGKKLDIDIGRITAAVELDDNGGYEINEVYLDGHELSVMTADHGIYDQIVAKFGRRIEEEAAWQNHQQG